MKRKPNLMPMPVEEPMESTVLPTESALAEAPEDIGGEEIINAETLREWNKLLSEYKSGKASIDRRTIEAEKWWKMRNQFLQEQYTGKTKEGFRAKSAWLHNIISNKHADAMDALPEPNILPREANDKEMAWALSKILPVIHEHNHFGDVYSQIQWAKLKTGTGVYKVSWDGDKLNGLGDISVTKTSVLNLFWEPGITDIQESKMVFHLELRDEESLKAQYPQLEDKQISSPFLPSENPSDDYVPKQGKVYVIDAYYKRHIGKKAVLHYCKYVGDTILFSSENTPELSQRGYYDHGMYPFVFDSLFPVEASPCGYGFVDISYNAQLRIDLMDTAFVKNTMVGATPRYFQRVDGNVNMEQFLDLEQTIVNCTGNLGEESLREISSPRLDGNHINIRNSTIDEIRETSGNTEAATGSATSGVTAASAIAALQEASGKGSRDSTASSYRAFAKVCELEIELIRQFYDLPRQFRILGDRGQQYFIPFTNTAMKMQHQGYIGSVDLGYRLPVYDIKVVPQKQNVYTKLSQNELAIQLFGMGAFNAQNPDPILMMLDMMDFDGKEELMQKISQQGTLYQRYMQLHQFAVTLAQQVDPAMAQGLMQQMIQENGGSLPAAAMPARALESADPMKEASHVKKARERAQTASQPGGGI